MNKQNIVKHVHFNKIEKDHMKQEKLRPQDDGNKELY